MKMPRARLVEWAILVSISLKSTTGTKNSDWSEFRAVLDGSGKQFDWDCFGFMEALYAWANSLEWSDAECDTSSCTQVRGGADTSSDAILCRNMPHSSTNPYAYWGKTYSFLSDSEEMSDDERMSFASRATQTETNPMQSSPPTKTNEPSLPKYAWEEVAGDHASTTPSEDFLNKDVPQNNEESRSPLMDLVGEGELSESEHEYLTRRLSSSHSPLDGSNLEGEPSREEDDDNLAHSPVMYRYFGRSRSRLHTADSVPFILLGPSVDHWKTAGKILASRGFNVMACERVEESGDGDSTVVSASASQPSISSDESSKNLVLAILDALRWNKAVLVGCDSESAMAIQAALQLAPERVAGLVLCGDLTSADDLVARLTSSEVGDHHRTKKNMDPFSLDYFLLDQLDCPVSVVWDGTDQSASPSSKGRKSSLSSSRGSQPRLAESRCLIIGGGTAPHRRLPEQFVWVLTRFVEEKVAPQPASRQFWDSMEDRVRVSDEEAAPSSDHEHRIILPFGMGEYLTPGFLIVAGRVAASAIYYYTAMRFAVFQYENIRNGMLGIKSRYQTVTSWRRNAMQSVSGFLQNYGSFFIQIFDWRGSSKRVDPEETIENKTIEESEVSKDDDINQRLRQIDYLDRVTV